jgi:hypothetical protein
MKKAQVNNKGITQTFHSGARSRSVQTPRPNSGDTEKPGRSTLVSNGLNTSVGSQASMPSHEQIAERARAIWTQHGRLDGQEKADWYEAEAQLRAEL